MGPRPTYGLQFEKPFLFASWKDVGALARWMRNIGNQKQAASRGDPARLRKLLRANRVSDSVPPSTRTVPTGRPAKVTIRSSAPAKEEQSSKIRMRDATDMWREDTPQAGSTEPYGGNHPQGKENQGHGAQRLVRGWLRGNTSHRLRAALAEAGFWQLGLWHLHSPETTSTRNGGQ